MKKLLLISFILLGVLQTNAQQYVWIQKANFGGGDRYGAFSFSINNLGYVGSGVTFTGTNIDYIYTDFWEYDPATNVWTQKADILGLCRREASGFTIGSKGYITCGWTPAQTDETFEYDPLTNTWTQKANFGGGGRYNAASFVIDTCAYVGMGYSPYYLDFWKYSPVTDSWTQIADCGGQPRSAATGFTIGNFGYVFGGGEQFQFYSNELWRYDPVLNVWDSMSNMPASGRCSSPVFTVNGKAFIGCGADANAAFQDFWYYEPTNDSWTQIPDFDGGPRLATVAFTIGNNGYLGTGSADNYPNIIIRNDLWELTYTDANNISGKLFMDYNNNNVQDAGEFPIPNKLISESNSGRFAFSRLDGTYNLAVLSSGSFTASTDSVGYFAPVPASHTVNFSGINETDSLNDFAYQATVAINDLCVTISPGGNFRAGFDAHYTISYENSGTTSLPGTVIFFPDTSLTFVSASVTPDSITPDSIVWDLGMLNPFQQGSIYVTVHVDVSAPIGTLINSSVRIEPVAGDANPICNSDFWELVTTGSFDPNDIIVNTDTLSLPQLINPPYLEYLVRFQNTGNDTAFTVDILNPVAAGVNLSSFELVSSSHTVAVRYIADYNTLGFKFNNILLVDSNMNEPLSHGFVRYRIKPLSSLPAGSMVENTAGIYFDFNPVVNTNTAVTHIVNPTSVAELSTNSVFVSPNPVKDKINIYTKSNSEHNIAIYNVKGECVAKYILQGKKIEIPFKNFTSGIYLLKIESGNEIIRAKIYKE